MRSLYSINDQRQRAINLDDTACRFTGSTDVNSCSSHSKKSFFSRDPQRVTHNKADATPLCIGRAVRRGQVDEHQGATYCTLSHLDSNISTPISVNQLCDSDGNDTLPIGEKMLLRMSPIIGMVEEAMLTCGLHCAWRICSRTQSTREGNEETASLPI